MGGKSKKAKAQSAEVGGGAEAGRLDDQLCFALYAATNTIIRAYRPFLTEVGLTYPQFLVLLVLWEHRSRRLGEIAEVLGLATHAVSPIIDRLEEAGLVVRAADADDGRAVQVRLTPAGSRLEPKAAAIQEEIRCLTLLADSEVVRLRADLKELVRRMDAE